MKFLLFLFLISNYFVTNAQSNENDFKKIIIEVEGEEIYTIFSITQDHQGYIWMVTNLGLIRYNGLEGKIYNNYNKNSSINNEFIDVLFVDSQGDIWIGTESGLSKYNPECDCFLWDNSINKDSTLTGIKTITEDKNKNIWIGTQYGGLFKFERESGELTRFLHDPSDSISVVNDNIEHLLVDKNNNLWIGTNPNYSQKGSGLLRFNIDSGEIKQFLHESANSNSLLDNRISALYEDQKGRILIGAYKCGFHIYDPKNDSLSRINFNPVNPIQLHAPYTEDKVFGNDPYVRLIHQDQTGNYWVGTTGKGINYFNTRTKTLNNYNFNLVNPQLLWTIYEDRQGSIWIGGIFGCGLFKIDLFARKYNLNTNFTNVEAAYESSFSPGILWIKSRQSGLSKMNLKTNEITRYLHDENDIRSIGHNWVRSAYQENNRTLWLGIGAGYAYGGHDGKGGVDRMDIEAETFTHFKLTRDDDGLNDFSYTVFNICEDSEGRLWAGAGPGGIFRSDKEKKGFRHFKNFEKDSLSKDVFLNIVRIDSNGDIWASDFAGEGTLYLYDRMEDKFNPYLKGFKMYNLLIDYKGWLLISTWEKGLVHLNPADGNYIQYTKKDGLPSNKALDIVEGENHIFWVGTRMGAAKFDAETGKIHSVGLPKGRYNSGIVKASDGQIYLGANKGLASFYPNQVTGNPYPPQITISEVLISGKNYLTEAINSGKLILSYNQNDITFKFIGLHFSNSAKNSYQFKLEPLDSKWIKAGFERTSRYTNLSPGSYNFQVKAASSDGVWTKTGKSISIIINPPWWQTWWAYSIFFVFAAVVIYGIRKYELNRIQLKNKLKLESVTSEKLRELDQVKSHFFANISHEFRTPLTLILGQINNTLSNKLDVKIRSNLEVANRNAQRLLHLINQLLDLSKIESGSMKINSKRADIVLFIKNIFYSFESLAEEKNITLNCTCEYKSIEIEYEPDKLEKVFLNLLSNAFKFTPEGGKIEVAISCTPFSSFGNKPEMLRFVEITVSDTGIGISAENIPRLFDRFYQVDNSATREYQGTGIGLAFAKELVELHGGRIIVESKEGKGSSFIVQLPFKEGDFISKEDTKTEKESSGKTNAKNSLPHDSVIKSENKISSITTNVSKENDKEIILVVEDNDDVRNYISEQLADDFQILEAADGREGISLAKKRIPDLIITDVMMPKKDGHQLTAELKQDEKTSHIPIIMLTAKAAFDNKIKGLETGADDYLIKPFNSVELLVRVKNLIATRRQLRKQFSRATIIKPSDVTSVSMDQKFLRKVLNVVESNISDELFSVEKLAEKANMSVSQLNRKLRALIDQPAGRLIRSMRLQRAADLLKINSGTIAEICYQVGFNDQTSFTRAFKKQFGVSPSAYKKNNMS